MAKKYYWLKLKNDFFHQREIKKLRKVAGGDTYVLIYLKMQLLSIKNDGIITFEGTEDHLDEQLSLELDEDLENIRMTLSFLHANALIEPISNEDMLLNKVPEMIGSETDSAERVRRLRERKKNQKALQCNGDVTKSNTEIELKKEKEREIELEKDNNIVETKVSTIPYELIVSKYNSILGNSLSKVMTISKSRKNKIKVRWNNDIKSIDGWEFLFNKVANTPFLLGDNKNGWKCGFDWLIANDSNFVKVLEGNYDKTDGLQAQVNVLERWANE